MTRDNATSPHRWRWGCLVFTVVALAFQQASVADDPAPKPPALNPPALKPPPTRPPAPRRPAAQIQAAQIQVRIQLAPGQAGNGRDDASGQRSREVGLAPADRQLLVRLSRAKKLLALEQYDQAVFFLQSLLGSAGDDAFPTDKKERTVLRSLHLEAERLIGDMPRAGRKAYEMVFGAEARRLLKAAVENSDRAQLEEVSRRFFHTQAGREAAYLLATIHLDQNRPLDAAVGFQRLRASRSATVGERNMLALQTAVAWVMADMPQRAASCLAELKNRNPQGLFLGGRTVKLFDHDRQALGWLRPFTASRVQPFPSLGEHWIMCGGDAARTAASVGGGPSPRVAWKAITSSWQVPVEEAPFSNGQVDVARQIEGILEGFQKEGSPVIPGADPLIVGDVLLIRTLTKLRAFDLATGEPKWANRQTNDLEQVRRGTVPPLPGDSGSILDPMLRDRIFANATYGSLSSDGRRVFCLEKLGFTANASTNPGIRRNPSPHPLARKTTNQMAAYAVNDGRMKWRLGGKPSEDALDLAGHFFLGPPLPLAGRLYCLAEVERRIRLLVLDAKTGKHQWSKSLHAVVMDVSQDEHRGQSGLSPSFAGGVLVCPTGAGLVVAVDLATRQLMWSYRYREPEDDDPQAQRMRIFIMARRAAMQGNPLGKKKGHWLGSLAVVSQGKVIVTPRDSEELHCLNLVDGTLLWKTPRDGGLYVGGVRDGKLIVVGNRSIQSLHLENGQPVWREPTEIPPPSGRGLLIGNQYHLPLSTAEVATVDLASGRISSRVKFDEGLVPGNLVSVRGRVVSQGAASVVCFERLETK